MIAFATLFLGLVIGTRPVTVAVTGPVTSIEFTLDGAPAARAIAAPWTADIDFGAEISPHLLVARALDAKGHEIARARQWLNLPRAAAEMQILLQRDGKGIVTGAQLAWESLLPGQPQSLTVTFDGRAIQVKGREVFDVPAYDPGTTHLLSAAAEFGNGVRCRADAVLGGRSASEAASELTGIAVRIPAGQPLPEPGALDGRFTGAGAPLHVVAVERGPAQVFVVRDLSEAEALAKLGRGGRTTLDARRGALPQFDADAMKLEMRLEDDDRIRFLWPKARAVATTSGTAELFDSSHDFAGRFAGFHWLLTRIAHPGKPDPERRFADATAVAGLQAIQSCTRRAVIVVLGRETTDKSRHSPAKVRAYLERIHVPLFVWSLVTVKSGAAGAWGEAEEISSVPRLKAAVERLKRELAEQAIVWVEGQHLPQEIALAEKAVGMQIVR